MKELISQMGANLNIWIPAFVSVLTLVVNLLFYLFVQPRITYQAATREALTKISVEFFNYLAEIVSYDSFEGVPTTIRKYSMQIRLYFKPGRTSGQLELILEEIFKETQKRKRLDSLEDIKKWNDNFRNLVKDLRKIVGKYCGVL